MRRRASHSITSTSLLAVGLIVVVFASVAQSAGDRPPLPPGCSLPDVRDTFSGFFRAARAGNEAAGVGYVAPKTEQTRGGPKPVFQIGSTAGERARPRRLVATNAPGALYRFLAARGQERRRFSLLSAMVASGRRSEAGPGVEVAFQVAERGGARPVRQAGGKVAINCESGQFSLWQMSINNAERTGSSCGRVEVDARLPPKRPVACRAPF